MNEASYRGGGLYSKDSVPILRNTIIAWSVTGEGVYSREGPLLPELSCCNLYRNRGGDWVGAIQAQRDLNGNLGADPLFCNRWLSSFTIGIDSPCAAAQSGECGPDRRVRRGLHGGSDGAHDLGKHQGGIPVGFLGARRRVPPPWLRGSKRSGCIRDRQGLEA